MRCARKNSERGGVLMFRRELPRCSLVLGFMALAALPALARLQQSPLDDVRESEQRVVDRLASHLIQMNPIPDSEPWTDPILKKKRLMMIAERQIDDPTNDLSGLDKKLSELAGIAIRMFGQTVTTDLDAKYQVADSTNINIRGCRLTVGFTVDVPYDRQGTARGGADWAAKGHDKITSGVSVDLSQITKIYSDGESIWLYSGGTAQGVLAAIIVQDSRESSSGPVPQTKEGGQTHARGVFFFMQNPAELDGMVADLKKIAGACQTPP